MLLEANCRFFAHLPHTIRGFLCVQQMFTTHHLPRSPSLFIFMSFHFVWLNFAAPPAHRWTSAVCVCVECSAGWYSKWRRNSSRANITELCGNRTVAAAFSRFRDIEMKKKTWPFIYISPMIEPRWLFPQATHPENYPPAHRSFHSTVDSFFFFTVVL